MKDKNTAGILALLLGGIGGHKFYLGQAGAGLLYLFFCWTFIPALVAFIEAISFFTMSDGAFNAKYNGTLLAAGSAVPGTQQAQNVVVNIPGHASAGVPRPVDVVQELKQLHELVAAGALTQDEFNQQKARLLSTRSLQRDA